MMSGVLIPMIFFLGGGGGEGREKKDLHKAQNEDSD